MGNCYNSIVVNAPIADVWKRIRNFHELDWAAGVVEKTEVLGDLKGDQLGARRLLNDVFNETLIGLSDEDCLIQYAINEGPGPLAKGEYTRYIGTVKLHEVTASNQTMVVWTSKWTGGNEGAIAELCNPIYVALLGALEKSFQ